MPAIGRPSILPSAVRASRGFERPSDFFLGSSTAALRIPSSIRTSATPRSRPNTSEPPYSPTVGRWRSIRITAEQNLEYVRTLLPEWVPKPEPGGLLDSFFFWHKTLARVDRSLGAAIAFGIAAVLLAVAIRFGQSALRTAAILPALVWAALIASVAVDIGGARLDEAVVIADETVARAADSALAPSTLPAPLPAGVEVRILERRSPWIRVRLANGRDAWVAESALMTVAEPDSPISD